jgi:hypothetical protein
MSSPIKLKCSRCNKFLSPDNFKKRKNEEYYKQCIECNKKISANKLKNTKKKKETVDYDISTHNKCSICFKILEISKFNKTTKGITKSCSECILNRKEHFLSKQIQSTKEDEQICVRCNIQKPLSLFSKTKDIYNKQCVECCNKYATFQKENKKSKKELLKKELSDNDMICNKCLNIKNKMNFVVRKNGKYNKQCIDCNLKQLEYLKNNKCEHGYLNKSACKDCNGSSYCEHDKIRTYCSECGGGSLCEHKTRKDRCIICRDGNQFCSHNKLRTLCIKCKGGSFCEHLNRRTRCIQCNFPGFLKYIVSSRVYKALKYNKIEHSIEYLGCDIEIFRKHLENKFKDGMNWNNYGSIWHIDHIIPIAYNNPSIEDVIKRLHYSNTQPLWALENISKGNRYIG